MATTATSQTRAATEGRLHFGVLGPVVVRREGEPVDIGVYKQRALLALLLIHSNRVVSTDRIIDELWGEAAGKDRQNALWVVVSRLRAILEPDRPRRTDGTILITRSPGYLLTVPPEDIDSVRFEKLAVEGRSLLDTDPARASVVLGDALAIWRGRPFEEFTYESFAAAEIARLEELRLEVVEDRVDAELQAGRSRELVGELESLTRQHPERERLTRHLMLALYRAGRQGDALRAFGSLRAYLGEEYGLEPSAITCSLEERIVLDDPELREVRSIERTGGPGEAGLSVRGYELRELIGSGSLGNVYRAFQPAVGREVAVKVIRPELANDPDFIRRFEREAQAVAQLEHPHIVPIFDYWREPGAAYLVTWYFERGSLLDLARRGPLGTDAAITIIEQVASALAAAHRQGVTHGSVKLQNVLIDRDGTAYLSDFCVSTPPGEPDAAIGGALAGREPRNTGRATMSSDLFALAVVAERLLSGSIGADSAPDSPLVGPAAVVIGRAQADDRADRYPDVESFVDALRSALGEVDQGKPAIAEIPNPYRGLRAFAETDADRFFGRERLVERLVVRLGQGGAVGRFVALVGPSGSGKSSVIRAGLLPAIRRGGLAASDRWFVTTMVPGRHPFEALEGALRRIAVDPPADLLERLLAHGIAAAIEATNPDRSAQVVLVVDQLEELFAQSSAAESAAFLDALATAASDPHSGVKVVTTLRADFYDHPLQHPSFGELLRLGTEVITPMHPPQLERAITGPAAGVGVSFETGLITQITADVAGQPNSLPLLQYALTELFAHRTGSLVTLDDYREIGGVTAALARRADSLYDGLPADDRPRVRDVFLRLVTLAPDAADTRRRAPVDELADSVGDDVSTILELFGRHRLLTFDRDPMTRGPTVEIAHEALLTSWSRLRDWIDGARADVHSRLALAAAAHEWDDRDREPDFLLAGARLGRYDGWLTRPPVRLTEHEREFLRASHDVAEHELDRERRRVRRLRRLVVGVAAALVVALVAGGLAFRQQRLAVAATDRAELAALVSRSAAAVDDDPDLALLLALEAHARASGPDTRRALLGALAGAGSANKLLSRQPLDGDCANGSDSFYTDDAGGIVGPGPVQLQVVDGLAVARDVVSGDDVEFGPMPHQCALGARNAGFGGAGDIEGRLWVGADWDVELDVRGSSLGATGDRLIVASFNPEAEEEQVRLYDVDGALVGRPVVGGVVTAWKLSQDGALLAVSMGDAPGRTTDGFLYVIDTATGEPIVTIGGQVATALGFDPFTGDLIAALADGVVITIDPRTGARRSEIATDESFGYLAAGALAGGALIMVSRSNIEVLDRNAGPIGRPFPIQDVRQAFVRADGLVVTIRNDGQADVYDLEANAVVDRSYDMLERGWIAMRDGSAAVLSERAGEDAAVELVNLSTGERSTPDRAMPDGSTFPAVAIYPTIDGVWAVSLDHRLARWQNGVLVDQLDMGSEPGVRNDDWYPGGRPFGDALAVLGDRPDGTIEASLVRLDETPGSRAEVVLTVATDLVHGDPDNSNALGVAIPGPTGGLLVVDQTGRLTEYGASGGVERRIDTGMERPVAVALDPSGARLAVSSLDGGVAIVDLATEAVENVPGAIIASSLGFDGDGTVLGISAWGGEVRLYDVGSGEVPMLIWDGTGTFGAEPGWYDAEADSLWLPASGKVLEIPLEPARWVAKACELVDRDLTQEEWDRYVPGDRPLRSVCG